MEKPDFDCFHPNADACNNACETADEGDFADACLWLDEAAVALEYSQLLENREAALEYVQHKAKEAGVELETTSKPHQTQRLRVKS